MGKKKKTGHDAHLCSLLGCEDLEDIVPLIGKPSVICTRCGRAANKKKNVCRPKKLSSFE